VRSCAASGGRQRAGAGDRGTRAPKIGKELGHPLTWVTGAESTKKGREEQKVEEKKSQRIIAVQNFSTPIRL